MRMNPRLAALGASAGMVICVMMIGCGKEPGGEPQRTEEIEVASIVSSASGAGDPEGFEKVFAEGAVHEEAELYGEFMFLGDADTVEIDGDTATVSVEVTGGLNEDVLGTVEWTAVKEDGEWKLNSAPIPDDIRAKAE